jgi:hypothetical protein
MMETETNEIKDITPSIAREITQEAMDWESIVQKEINERVPEKAKRGERECRIVIGLPKGMKQFSATTLDIIRAAFIRKDWAIKNFGIEPGLGAIIVDIEW